MPPARPRSDFDPPERHSADSGQERLPRAVILGDEDAQWLAEQGLVISAGPESLTIRANAHFQPGDRIFIEFPVEVFEEAGRTAIIRGQVTEVRESEGAFLLEVRLKLMPGLRPAHVDGLPQNRGEAARLLRGAQEDLESAGRSGALPVADIQRFLGPPHRRHPATTGRWRRQILAGTVLAAIVLALLLAAWPVFRLPANAWRVTGLAGRDPAASRETSASDSPDESSGAGRLTGSTSNKDEFLSAEPYTWQPGDWVRVDDESASENGQPGAALSPSGWILATLEPAASTRAGEGQPPPALALLVSEMLGAPDQSPSEATGVSGEKTASPGREPGERAAADSQTTEGVAPFSSPGAANAGEAAPADGRPEFSPAETAARDRNASPAGSEAPAARAGSPAGYAPGSVAIRVSKRDHTLSIHRGDALLARFPVGLGRNNATPEGDFLIANKVTDPDWSDRGRIVKAGDPENPLGRRWLGLEKEGRATPYGIHPTNEPHSIGADMSRGCIRMRPEDAETLFQWCPVGTKVTVTP
ncbi:MAG: L,D-transpeptidase family protein [Candidatus Hydrogenedentales bacterium]